MKKILGLLLGLTFLTGCAESLALLGPTTTAISGGNIAQSAFSSAVNYGLKKQTGKSAMEHAMTYAEEMNPQKKKEPCLSFAEKTNSEICLIVKKQIDLALTFRKSKTPSKSFIFLINVVQYKSCNSSEYLKTSKFDNSNIF